MEVNRIIMSVIQSQQKELRFLKRKALEQESRIIGNALRDQIRAYGVDCIYYKLNETGYTDFKNIVDSNTVLRRAYGYDIDPDYTMSVHMITYADVQTDIFQLNKYGHMPNAEIDFNFDKIDFACALASKYGQLREYQIDQTPVFCNLPGNDDTSMFPFRIGEGPYTQELSSFPQSLSAGIVPQKLEYRCDMLTGWFCADIDKYEYNQISNVVVSSTLSDNQIRYIVLDEFDLSCKYNVVSNIVSTIVSNDIECPVLVSCFNMHEYTIPCMPYQHTEFNVKFPVNEDLYRSLQHELQNDEFLETKLYLTFVVNKIKTASGHVKNVLSGYVHGSLLFFDIDMIGKYVRLIRPAIGDLIAIDFPSEDSKEIYEITDCFDKQLTQDGISPLLHNYIWKCKAKRYVNAHEDKAPVNPFDEQIEEHQTYDQLVDGIVTEEISMYETLSNDIKEDAVYGGYDSVIDTYDNQVPRPSYDRYDYIEDGSGIVLMNFKLGSKLVTNGYDLMFIDKCGKACNITTNSIKTPSDACVFEQNLRWLKATDSQIVFVNVEGESTAVAMDGYATSGEIEICLNSLHDKTLDTGEPINEDKQSFFKFKGTRSYLWSDGMHLFAKLASNEDLHFIA